MFKERVSETALTSNAANEYFEDVIYGDSYTGDCTLVSSLRALFTGRLPQGRTIHARIMAKRFPAVVNADDVNGIIDFEWLNASDKLVIFGIIGDGSSKAMDFIGDVCKERMIRNTSLQESTDLRTVFKPAMDVRIYQNAENRTTVVFLEGITLRRLHYLQAALFKLLPWYYDKDKGASELDRRLIYSFRKDSSEEYLDVIREIATQIDFVTARLTKMLSGFEKKMREAQMKEINESLINWEDEYHRLESAWAKHMATKDELELKKRGMESRLQDDENNLLEYFSDRRRFSVYSARGNEIIVQTKGYMMYHDEETLETFLDNLNSIIYRHAGKGELNLSKVQIKKLLTAVFIDSEIKLRVCATFRIDCRNRKAEAISHWSYDGAEFGTYMQNPHLHCHACLGNNRPIINNAMAKYDVISAVEQCYASSQSLNWNDSTVIGEFMQVLAGYDVDRPKINCKAFELPDGRIVNSKGAVEYLEAKEKHSAADK